MKGILSGVSSVVTRRRINIMRNVLYMVSVSMGLLLGCGTDAQPSARVELWIQGDLSRVDGLESIEFVIRDAHLQPAGFEIYPDHRVTEEWLPMATGVQSFWLRSGDTSEQRIATLDVISGAYDRVFLRPQMLVGFAADNGLLTVKNVMEPIAAQFETLGDPVKILLKVIVLPTSRGEEDVSIFAQDTLVTLD